MKIKILIPSVFVISFFLFSGCSSTENQEKDDSFEKGRIEKNSVSQEMENDLNETSTPDVKQSAENKSKTIAKPARAKQPEFINTAFGKPLPDEFKGDLMTQAAKEVYIKKSGACGDGDCGKKIVLFNTHPTKDVNVSVRISWKENDNKTVKKRSYLVKAGQVLSIGCSAICSEHKTTVKWGIIGAVYAK